MRLRELERTAKLYKEELEAATAKYQEALSRESAEANPADARIVQRALAPQNPSFPKKFPILAFATIAGFVLSLGAVVAGELLKTPPGGSRHMMSMCTLLAERAARKGPSLLFTRLAGEGTPNRHDLRS